ncbi:helix-turn-helix domain-containing protein [Agromyces sp. GXQ0307]|uniref:helix-turn-helix domain-containing protein n=1 Tax=Agromyces sp. GXQ0307 TaxID=3377835 RepID=UPI00383AA270
MDSAVLRYAPQEFSPDWAVPPGRMILRELEAGGFSQADIAARANISAKHLNQIVKGHVPLTPEVAVSLERVLGASADTWLRMEATWQAHRVRLSAQESFATLAAWVRKFPARLLRSRRITDDAMSLADQADSLLRFFQVADAHAFDRVWLTPQASYKRSQKFDIDPYATALWLRLTEVEAERLVPMANQYDADALKTIAHQVPALTRLPFEDGFRRAQDLLASAGVLLVFVPEVDKTRITGASRWLHATHPVIALTGRHKFLDVFWFALLHEIGHVLLHPKRATYLDVEKARGADDDHDRQETAANKFAESLIMQGTNRAELLDIEDEPGLRHLAARLNVAPGILAGQYGFAAGDWRKFAKLRESVDIAAELALNPIPS